MIQQTLYHIGIQGFQYLLYLKSCFIWHTQLHGLWPVYVAKSYVGNWEWRLTMEKLHLILLRLWFLLQRHLEPYWSIGFNTTKMTPDCGISTFPDPETASTFIQIQIKTTLYCSTVFLCMASECIKCPHFHFQ